MIDTARCHECKRQFPDHLIDTLYMGNLGDSNVKTKQACPICALELSNKLHGIRRKKFGGPIANSMLNQAHEYLRGKKLNVR